MDTMDTTDKTAAEKKRSFFGRKYRSVYGDQLICLCALLIMGVWRWGVRAFAVCLVSVAVSMLADWLCCRLTKKTYNFKDLSTVVSGMCLGLLMPATVSYACVIFGAALAMGIKHIFGGKNNYIFNPACLSYAFLAVSWPSQILMFPALGENIPLWGDYSGTLYSGLESYLVRLGTAQELSLSDIFLGNFLGAIGTTHVLILVVCGLCLIFRRALSPVISLVTLGVFMAGSFLFPSFDNVNASIVIELICGNLLFGLLFLANDPQTMPKSILGRIYYGILMGALLVIFRHLTKTETSFVFVLLLANAFSIHIDRFAEKTADLFKNGFSRLKNIRSFEKVKSEAQSGEPAKPLGDTQEIIVPLLNYNMPAVDNKVIKAAKKPPKIVRGKDNVPVRKEGGLFSSKKKKEKKKDKSGRSPKTEAPPKGGKTKPEKKDKTKNPKKDS